MVKVTASRQQLRRRALAYVHEEDHIMASRKRRGDGELWGAEGADNLWSGDEYEVAIISKQTNRSQIDVRRAIMKVGANRQRVIAELSGQDSGAQARGQAGR